MLRCQDFRGVGPKYFSYLIVSGEPIGEEERGK